MVESLLPKCIARKARYNAIFFFFFFKMVETVETVEDI